MFNTFVSIFHCFSTTGHLHLSNKRAQKNTSPWGMDCVAPVCWWWTCLIAGCRMKLPFIQILHIRSVKCRDICRCWMQDCLVNVWYLIFLFWVWFVFEDLNKEELVIKPSSLWIVDLFSFCCYSTQFVNNLLLLVCRLKSWKLWSDQFNKSSF